MPIWGHILQSEFEQKQNLNVLINENVFLFQDIFDKLRLELYKWQKETNDPWLCSPHSVLEDKGFFKDHAQCMPLFN